MHDEAARIRRYLHPFTYERIELECHSWLICEENIEFINESCSEIVQREQWKGKLDFACYCSVPWSITCTIRGVGGTENLGSKIGRARLNVVDSNKSKGVQKNMPRILGVQITSLKVL